MPTGVIRFVALNAHGLADPFTGLILGHGEDEEFGLSHANLVKVYCYDLQGADNRHIPMYAGYLRMLNDIMTIHVGGSRSLDIKGDVEKDEWVLENLQCRRNLRRAVASLHPLLNRGVVEHVLLAPQ